MICLLIELKVILHVLLLFLVILNQIDRMKSIQYQ